MALIADAGWRVMQCLLGERFNGLESRHLMGQAVALVFHQITQARRKL